MIYVVDDGEVTHFVGINWRAARVAARDNQVNFIRVWRHNKLIMKVDHDKKVVWVASHLESLPFGFEFKT